MSGSQKKEVKKKGDKKQKPRARSFDQYILFATFVLVSIGIVMVFSASYVQAGKRLGDQYYFLKRNIAYAVIGMFAMFFMAFFHYKKVEKYAWFFAGISILFLVAVLTPLGTNLNGAQRWIRIGGMTLMPSELAKFASIVLIAKYINRKYIEKSIGGALFPGIISVFFFGLVFLQPDLSTAGTIVMTGVCMMFVAGLQLRYAFIAVGSAIPAVLMLAMSSEYRWKRVTGFLDPFKDELGNNYQVIQSLYALGTGGLFGLGLGRSNEKFLYIPEPQNDFIFAIIGEELGYVGCIIILMLYVFLIYRGIKVAMNAPDFFSCMLVSGIISQIAIQIMINIAVVTSSMPATGMPLPFISFGGTSLIILMAAIGVVLNVSRYTKR